MSDDTQVKQEDDTHIEAPERVYMHVYADADCWCSYHFDKEDDPRFLTEYVRADLLATVRREAFKEARNIVNGLFHNSEVNHSRWNEAITAAAAALQAPATEKGEMNG